MNQSHPLLTLRVRLLITALITLVQAALLVWAHFHGGVPSHHLLHRADMPAISNAWGLLALPALTWWALMRIQRRIVSTDVLAWRPVILGFVIAFAFGAALATAFSVGANALTGALFQALLFLTLVLPLYRAECVLGFVLAMTITFGAVLPTLVALVLAAMAAAVHLGLYQILAKGWRRLTRTK